MTAAIEDLAMPVAGSPNKADGAAGWSRTVRVALYWATFVTLFGWTLFGFWSHPTILAGVWTPSGQTRFLLFAAAYAVAVLVVYLIAAPRLPLILAVIMVVSSCGAVGIGAPAAAALFLFSSLVLGSALLWRRAAPEAVGWVDRILAMLLGAVVYMTVTGWTAMLPIHYAIVHAVILALPLVIWPSVAGQCLKSLSSLLRPVAWDGALGYAAFALAAFIPLVHLLDAVLLPQLNSDAVAVHLAVPSIIAFNHFWAFDVHRFVYAAIPMGASWLILPPYLLGGEFAARLINFCFFLVTCFLFFSVVRRFLVPATAWLLTALLASTPFFLTENGNIFVENIWVALLFAAYVSFIRFRETAQERYLLLMVVLTATSLAVKLLGAVLIFVLLLFAIGDFLRKPARIVWSFAIFALAAAYPYAFAFIKTGNPVFPFMNNIFQSPLYYPTAFAGMHRSIPSSLYEMTFLTERYMDNGGGNGSMGFHYLVLLPLALLALRKSYPYIGILSIALATAMVVSVALLAEVNLRYLYPAFPLSMVAVAIAYAHTKDLSRKLYVALCAFAVVTTAVNAYAMPSSAWAHREFSLAMVLGRTGVDRYRDWGAPERRVIDYLNLTRGRSVRVANFARSMQIDLQGEIVFGMWYDYVFTTQKVSKATSAEEVLRLMREEGITRFIAFAPGFGSQNYSPVVEAFLSKYTEPEFSVGDVYLARYKESVRFSTELLKNGEFTDDLAEWRGANPAMLDPGSGAVAVTGARALAQRVPVDDRVTYRYAIKARCVTPDTHVRVWVGWLDEKAQPIDTVVLPRVCEASDKEFAAELVPPFGARLADVWVGGNEVDKPVLVSGVSFKR